MTVASAPRGHDNVGPLAKRTNGCATASRHVFEDLFRLAQESFLNPDRDSGARLRQHQHDARRPERLVEEILSLRP